MKVTLEGKVKVLDFGLAKAFEGEVADANISQSPTLSMAATQAGIILGTAAYMSPEQARGETADRRSDVWAFGCVLFEMLTGHGTFGGKTVSDVLAGVLRAEPAWNSLPNVHNRIRTLVERCLEKEWKDRLSAISDARVEIQRVLADPNGVTAQPLADVVQVKPQSKLPWAAAIVLALVLGGVVAWNLRPGPQTTPVSRSVYELPDGLVLRNAALPVVDLSPDGQQFLFNGFGSDLGGVYVQPMDEFEPRLVPATESTSTAAPTFSPDGQEIVYGQGSQVMKVAVQGGAPIALARIDGQFVFGMSWESDGTILYGQPDGIWRVSENGGEAEHLIVSEPGEAIHGPRLLPGGEWVLFTLTTATGPGRWNQGQIVAESLRTGERQVLLRGATDARFVPTGHLVYAFEDELFAVPFDIDGLQVTGGAVSIVQGVQRAGTGAGGSGAAQYAVSDTGTLIYVPGAAVPGPPDSVLAFVSRGGETERLDLNPDQYRSPRLSPDGDSVAVEIVGENGSSYISIYDLSGESQIRRLTLPQEGNNYHPIWSPDGERVTFTSDRAEESPNTASIYWQLADGSGPAVQLTTAEEGRFHRPESWSPDGGVLSFSNTRGAGIVGARASVGLWHLSLDGGEADEFYNLSDSNQVGSSFSPDGNWLAYGSQEDEGRFGVYVQNVQTGARFQIANNGEASPSWSRDGTELFYRVSAVSGRPQSLNSVQIQTEPSITFSNEQSMALGFLTFVNYQNYDITPDDGRFLVLLPAEESESEPVRPQINVVTNWFEELKERVPVE